MTNRKHITLTDEVLHEAAAPADDRSTVLDLFEAAEAIQLGVDLEGGPADAFERQAISLYDGRTHTSDPSTTPTYRLAVDLDRRRQLSSEIAIPAKDRAKSETRRLLNVVRRLAGTQERLAKVLGIKQSSVSRLLNMQTGAELGVVERALLEFGYRLEIVRDSLAASWATELAPSPATIRERQVIKILGDLVRRPSARLLDCDSHTQIALKAEALALFGALSDSQLEKVADAFLGLALSGRDVGVRCNIATDVIDAAVHVGPNGITSSLLKLLKHSRGLGKRHPVSLNNPEFFRGELGHHWRVIEHVRLGGKNSFKPFTWYLAAERRRVFPLSSQARPGSYLFDYLRIKGAQFGPQQVVGVEAAKPVLQAAGIEQARILGKAELRLPDGAALLFVDRAHAALLVDSGDAQNWELAGIYGPQGPEGNSLLLYLRRSGASNSKDDFATPLVLAELEALVTALRLALTDWSGAERLAEHLDGALNIGTILASGWPVVTDIRKFRARLADQLDGIGEKLWGTSGAVVENGEKAFTRLDHRSVLLRRGDILVAPPIRHPLGQLARVTLDRELSRSCSDECLASLIPTARGAIARDAARWLWALLTASDSRWQFGEAEIADCCRVAFEEADRQDLLTTLQAQARAETAAGWHLRHDAASPIDGTLTIGALALIERVATEAAPGGRNSATIH